MKAVRLMRGVAEQQSRGGAEQTLTDMTNLNLNTKINSVKYFEVSFIILRVFLFM